MQVAFHRISGDALAVPDGLVVKPTTMVWEAVGGPNEAELDVQGEREGLANLYRLLGQAVTIYNDLGEKSWWGYVNEVSVSLGKYQVGLTLEDVYNTVAIAYTYQDADNITQRGTTDWFQNGASVAEYGRRELLYSYSDLDSLSHAEDLAQLLANRFAQPVRTLSMGGGGIEGAKLLCRGWYDTLHQRYYQNLAGRLVYDVYNTGHGIGVGYSYAGDVMFDSTERKVFQIGEASGFKEGDKVVISGTSNNNKTVTVQEKTEVTSISYTSSGIRFTATDDLYDSNQGFDGIQPGDWILVKGSTSNDGMYKVGKVEFGIDDGGTTSDHIELDLPVSVTLTAETAGASVTIKRESYFQTAENLTDEGPTSATLTAWGTKIIQSFTLPVDAGDWDAVNILLRVRKVGSPTDHLYVRVYTDNAGVPGTLLEDTYLSYSYFGTEFGWENFDMGISFAPTLSYGTTYWLQVDRYGSNDAFNYYEVAIDEGAGYTDGVLRLWDGAAWQQRPVDASLAFQMYDEDDTGVTMAKIIDDVGDKLSGTNVYYTSQYGRIYSDGDALAVDELERLLLRGESFLRRVLIRITEERKAIFYQQPSSEEVRYLVRGDGRVLDLHGNDVPPAADVVGKWVKLDEPHISEELGDSILMFVERAEYRVEQDEWQLTPENAPDPYDIATTEQG